MNFKTTTSLILFALTMNGCAAARFGMNSTDNQAATGAGAAGSPLVCDPFAKENIVDPKAGLKGAIYTLDAASPRYNRSQDYEKYGIELNADLFLSQVNVPTRSFDQGFVSDNGILLDTSNKPLLTYYGLKLTSSVVLTANDDEGDYQFALLSDDGASLFEVETSGNLKTIVDNEGDHSTAFGCATTAVSMKKSKSLPIQVSYYQGPANHIALVMMWRKVAAKASLADAACGQATTYFDINNKSAPTSAYQALLNRGWKPVPSGNFQMTEGKNLCAI